MDPLITTNREAIRRIARRHGAYNVRVFGSRVRDHAEDGSDVDLLIEAGPERSFFFPGGLIADLEELLGCRVEIVTEEALHPALREQVLQEAEPV